MDHSDIRRELDHNLQGYQSNVILNKLTPSKRLTTRDDLSLNSSIRRSTRSSGQSSRLRITPGKNRATHNDSNIVTSPVKTLRRHAGSKESTVSYGNGKQNTYGKNVNGNGNDQDNDSEDSSEFESQVQIPLNDSPKKPLRKGTPKQQSVKSSQRSLQSSHSKSRDGDNPFQDDVKSSKSRSSFTTRNFTTKVLTTKNPANDDDDEFGEDHSLDTLFSDLPNDLLSPERHIYPKNNLTSSKKKPLKNIPDLTNSLYPSFESSKDADTHVRNSSFKVPSHATSLSPSIPNTMTNYPSISSQYPIQESTRPVQTEKMDKTDYLTRFDSSDEEPVPELTVPLDLDFTIEKDNKKAQSIAEPTYSLDELVNHDTSKRKYDEAIQENGKKRKVSLYPDLSKVYDPSNKEKEKKSAIEKEVEKEKLDSFNQPEKMETHNVKEAATKNISIYPVMKEDHVAPQTTEVEKEKEKQQQLNGTEKIIDRNTKGKVHESTSKDKDGELRDPDHWSAKQWRYFIKFFQKFQNNNYDYEVFNKEVLRYLKCDEDEILIKIAFLKEYEDELMEQFGG